MDLSGEHKVLKIPVSKEIQEKTELKLFPKPLVLQQFLSWDGSDLCPSMGTFMVHKQSLKQSC